MMYILSILTHNGPHSIMPTHHKTTQTQTGHITYIIIIVYFHIYFDTCKRTYSHGSHILVQYAETLLVGVSSIIKQM